MRKPEIRRARRLGLHAAAVVTGVTAVLSLGTASSLALAASPAHPAASGTLYGYAAAGGTITSVTGRWKVPTPKCTSSSGQTAIWASLGGSSSPTSDLLGVNITCSGSKPVYKAFVEFSPQPPMYFTNPVKAGDTMTVSIATAGSRTVKTEIRDTTQGWSHSVTGTGAASSSANWVVDDPTSLTWTPVTFHLGVNASPAFTKIVGSNPKIKVSTLTSGSFTVSWAAAPWPVRPTGVAL